MSARSSTRCAAPDTWFVTPLAKLVRTTAFKLMAVYLLVFTLFAAFLLGYFFWNAQRLLGSQINSTIDAEISSLAEQYSQGGIVRLIASIDRRSHRPGSLLYLVTNSDGESLAGNVAELPSEILDKAGWTEVPYTRYEEGSQERRALVRVFDLSGGFRLLVGLDLEEQRMVRRTMLTAALWSAAFIIVLGVAGGWFVTRRVLHR